MRTYRISLLITGIIVSVVAIILWSLVPRYHPGDRVILTSVFTPDSALNERSLPVGTKGVIKYTYEYNNYHSTALHTGYLVSVGEVNYMFDHPTFTLVTHK